MVVDYEKSWKLSIMTQFLYQLSSNSVRSAWLLVKMCSWDRHFTYIARKVVSSLVDRNKCM